MDRDVRTSIRTLHSVGFEGLSVPEIKEFVKTAQAEICYKLFGLRVGDEIKRKKPNKIFHSTKSCFVRTINEKGEIWVNRQNRSPILSHSKHWEKVDG